MTISRNTSRASSPTQLGRATILSLPPLPKKFEDANPSLSRYRTFFDDVKNFEEQNSSPRQSGLSTSSSELQQKYLQPVAKKNKTTPLSISLKDRLEAYVTETANTNTLFSKIEIIFNIYDKEKFDENKIISTLQEDFSFKALENMLYIMQDRVDNTISVDDAFRKKYIKKAIKTHPDNPEKTSKPVAKKRKTES